MKSVHELKRSSKKDIQEHMMAASHLQSVIVNWKKLKMSWKKLNSFEWYVFENDPVLSW